MILRNLTPHEVVISTDAGPLRLAPEQPGARCEEERTDLVSIAIEDREIALVTIGYGAPIGLPDEEEGTLLVVSKIIADAAPHRTDLVMPDRVVRDDQGRVIACQGLAQPRRP